jgi:GNAT superfamily N-acetyltransferase
MTAKPNDGIEVRLANEADAALVLDLAMRAFAEFRETLIPPPGVLRETSEVVRDQIRDHWAALAFHDGSAVGSVRFEDKSDFVYIGRLAVPPEFRGAGVGGALMAFAEQQAQEIGRMETRVQVREALPGNIAMFEHLGYAPIAREPHPNVPEAGTVILAKRLIDISD